MTELKTRRQKPGESLQVLAADVERLMSLAYAEWPGLRFPAQYFVNAIRDKDTRHARRLMDAKYLKPALAYSMKIYVADITEPCTLGLDFLQKFNFTVDNEKNELRTGGEEIALFSASAEHSKLCSALAKEKTIIPARSECRIQGVPEVSGKFRYALTDFPSQVSQKDVLAAATLVDLKREAIPVRVLNLDNKPKTVDKGAVIATCEPVVDIVARPQKFSESLSLPSIM
ncbi:hypothetical protein AVEN_210209-1 [Araneus ventricosus]|uniref:Uncharacterized protein n=1 Tax=Araneus ventricosus TaxID=182803 RepID=A0A4Y2FVC3_ARAVE|nr:hypothetical protein AVEN_210209-1 [Araneus ventricosus]